MHKAKILFGALVPVAAAIITACSSGGGGESVVESDDIKTTYVAMAYAAYSDSLSTAEALQDAVDAFIATPNEQNLAAARAAYKAARVPYQQSEIMRFDTAVTIDFDLAADGGPASVDDWEGQVNAWPLDEVFIENIIAGTDTINIDLLLAQNGAGGEANVTTGVHAVEFMLWGSDNNGTGPGAGERAAIEFDTNACPDSLCARRSQYLKAATDLLVADLTEMVAEWSPQAEITQGTLAYNFLFSNQALDYILGSINAMATDELASARMGSGLILGDPEEEHDCFSDFSHIAIYYNFQGVRNAFYGGYASDTTTVSGTGLGDLLRARDAATYDAIDSALNSIEAKMRTLLELGERSNSPVRFDQIIGQGVGGTEYDLALAASDELVALGQLLRDAGEVLSLSEISTDGSGDGD